jgi:hypothetical protein
VPVDLGTIGSAGPVLFRHRRHDDIQCDQDGASQERRPLMLDEAEQRQLAQIEAGLMADDPGWVQRLHASAVRRRRRRSAAVAVAVPCIVVTAIAAGIVVGGAAVGFVAGVVAIGAAAVFGMHASNTPGRRA